METLPPAVAPVLASALVVPVPPTPETPTCASCHTPLAGPYCHACGEKRLHRHDYALKHFLEHTVDTVTHFDLRVLRDLWLQLRRPGFLAAEWLQGRRVAHTPPVQLFLVTNLLFYLAVSASHFSAFETRLKYHFANVYGRFAYRLVQQHLRESGVTLEAFARHFNELAHVYSKSLVFLFIPLLSAPLWLLFRRQRRYFVEWLMLGTSLFAGMLLIYALMAPLMLGMLSVPALRPVASHDGVLSLFMAALTLVYMAAFMRGAFPRQPWALRWGRALVLTFGFALAMMIPYRFVLFLACYWAAS